MAEPKRDWPKETSVEGTGPNEEDTERKPHSNSGSTSASAGAGSNWKEGIIASLLFSNPHANTLQLRAPVRGVSRRYQFFAVFLTAVRRQNRQHIVQRMVNSTTHIAAEDTVTRTFVSFPRIGVKVHLQLIVGAWKLKVASPLCSAVLSVIPGGFLLINNFWDFLSSSWGSLANTGHLVWTNKDIINAVGNFVKNHPNVVSYIGRIGFRLWNFYAKCLGVPAKFRDCMHVAWALLQCFGVHHIVVPAIVFLLAYVHARPVYRRSVSLRSAALEDDANRIGLYQFLPGRPPTLMVFRHRVVNLRTATLADAQNRVGLLVVLPATPRIISWNRPAAQAL